MTAYLLDRLDLSPQAMRRAHGVAMDVWLLAIPLTILTGWIFSLGFISAVSIYANFASHFGGYQAARAEAEAQDDDPEAEGEG